MSGKATWWLCVLGTILVGGYGVFILVLWGAPALFVAVPLWGWCVWSFFQAKDLRRYMWYGDLR